MKLKLWKLLLDIALAVTLVLLYDTHTVTGLSFHEWAGIAIGIAFIVHIVLNWRWVVQVTRSLFASRTGARGKMLYVLDVVILLVMGWAVVSGVFISKVAVPGLANHLPLWRATHLPSSYLALVLIGLHVGLHWGWVMQTVRQTLGRRPLGIVGTWIARTVALLLFIGGAVVTSQTDTLEQIALLPASITAPETVETGHGKSADADHDDESGEDHSTEKDGIGRGQGGTGRGHGGGGGRGMGGQGHGGGGHPGDLESTLEALVLFTGVLAATAVPMYYLDRGIVAVRRRQRAAATTGSSGAS